MGKLWLVGCGTLNFVFNQCMEIVAVERSKILIHSKPNCRIQKEEIKFLNELKWFFKLLLTIINMILIYSIIPNKFQIK